MKTDMNYFLLWFAVLTVENENLLVQLIPSGEKNVTMTEMVVIVCKVKNASFMEWSSDEYIGEGQRLQYLFTDRTGDIRNSSKESDIFANLTSLNSTSFIIESELHITVSANYKRSNVTCHNPGNDEMETLTLILIGREECIVLYIHCS